MEEINGRVEYTPFWGPERQVAGNSGQNSGAGVLPLCCTITVHIEEMQEGYLDGSIIPYDAYESAQWGLLEETVAPDSICEVYYTVSPDTEYRQPEHCKVVGGIILLGTWWYAQTHWGSHFHGAWVKNQYVQESKTEHKELHWGRSNRGRWRNTADSVDQIFHQVTGI